MLRWVATFASALLLAAPAVADSPAAAAAAIDAGRGRAERSFRAFAADWMAKVRRLEQRGRRRPSPAREPGAAGFTYRGYGADHEIELRPTGQSAAPYVGLLRYVELLYRCPSPAATHCRVASSVPVTEIFRYHDGRWSY